jgi:hypothetical protein
MKDIRLVEHVKHSREMINAHKMLVIKTEGKRQIGRTTLH